MTFRRIVWGEGRDSLENRISASGFLVLAIVPLGHNVYDFAVSYTGVNRFDREYGNLEPFGYDDPLVQKYGYLSAVEKTIEKYKEELEGGGVCGETEEWFQGQLTAFQTLKSEIVRGTMVVSAPAAPGIFYFGGDVNIFK